MMKMRELSLMTKMCELSFITKIRKLSSLTKMLQSHMHLQDFVIILPINIPTLIKV